MTHVRNLIRDLIDRRLWPVALLLVGVLAAVPVVLGRSGGEDAGSVAALPAPPATDAAGEKAEVTLDASAPVRRDRGGDARNPFKPPASATRRAGSGDSTRTVVPSSATGAPTAPSASSSGAGASGSTDATAAPTPSTGTSTFTGSDSGSDTSGSSSGGSTAPKTTPKPKSTAKPTAEDAKDTYHVSLRIGVNGGEPKTMRDVARLSALPSVSDPFFVYLGVLETQKTHEKRAVFMVSSDAVPNGEGACHPTKQDCETVELTVDQTVYFDYTAPDGKVTQYELQLAGIHKTEVHSEAKAQAAIARHSNAGAELLRDAAVRNGRAAAGARSYRYLPGIGMLVRAKRAAEARVASDALALHAGGAAALLPRRRQPGIPVWHSPRRTPKR